MLRSNLLFSYVRAESPFGVIPMLDFDGKIISGSTGIARWIAEDYGKDMIKQSCSQYRINIGYIWAHAVRI